MVKPDSELIRVEVRSRAEWRAWLRANHRQEASLWLVTFKKAATDAACLPFIGYDALVEEALCFGWIDSLPRALDTQRTMLRMSPRKRGSAWSAINRARIERLSAAGLMHPAGLATVAAAKIDGSWDRLTQVDLLTVPADLAGALTGEPAARRFFERFPPSSRRAILEWIAQARSPETRARRVATTIERAAANRKANFPAGRDKGPPET
jgi:uncharacterized protein YdeI (YjbR/CyaY-like superfamily)